MPAGATVSVLRQTGSSLVEVAISLLVVSVATVGLAGLQISAKHLGHQAMQRTEAAALAMDLLERMRGNRTVLAHYRSKGMGAASGADLARPDKNCDWMACRAAELAAWDLWNWERALNGATTGRGAGGLVRPLACIAVLERAVTVLVTWEAHPSLPPLSADSACDASKYGEGESRQALRITSYIGVT